MKQNAVVANELLQNFSKKFVDSKNCLKLFEEFINKYEVSGNLYRNSHECMTNFKIEEIEIAAYQLHKNRAKDKNNVSVEHIVFAHPIVYYHLSKLFELISKHGLVPNEF